MNAPAKSTSSSAARKAPAKSPASVTPIDAAKAVVAAKTAPQKKTSEKPPMQRELSTVGALLKPNKLDWTGKDGSWFAVSGRWRYRVKERSSGGWFAEQATGSWTPLHADGQTVEQAKRIAEIVDGGAHWVAWAKYRVQTWAEIEKAAAEAGKQ